MTFLVDPIAINNLGPGGGGCSDCFDCTHYEPECAGVDLP